MNHMEKRIENLQALEHEVRNFLQTLEKDSEKATLVTLSGELGAGKTTFAKAVARALGIEEAVTSPTFVLEKIYTLPKRSLGFSRLVHIDAYRLKDEGEFATLNFDERMADPENLVLLEWPERVASALPKSAKRIHLVANSDGTRTLAHQDS
jgi:tRNA threonylcarbamoyladenosine biosynthesis protein TsaE